MNNEAEIISQLKTRLENRVSWAKDVEEFATAYGTLEPSQVAQLLQ